MITEFSFWFRTENIILNVVLRKTSLTSGSCSEALCFMKWNSSLHFTRLHVICTRWRSTAYTNTKYRCSTIKVCEYKLLIINEVTSADMQLKFGYSKQLNKHSALISYL